jgi:hypothetical protein
MTLRSGGPFNGTVTVTITTATKERLVVEATWRVDGDRRSARVKCAEFHEARSLAHNWAALLGIGQEPPG